MTAEEIDSTMAQIEAQVAIDAELSVQHLDGSERRVQAFERMFRRWQQHPETRTRALIYVDITRQFSADEIVAACDWFEARAAERAAAPYPSSVLALLETRRLQ